MARFGDLIDIEVPVLLEFYIKQDEISNTMYPVLKDVANALGKKAKVIKIDLEKNNKLAEALRIKGAPTLMIYKRGEMKWRQSGDEDANSLIDRLKDFCEN
jgi:thioredoxin 1|tara:strand:- start:234 stop:536 length:303 start_codon:yes stop_codon:yes gene_type:complete